MTGFGVWKARCRTWNEPAEDMVDLKVSPALVDVMWKPRQEREGSGFVRGGADEYSAVEDVDVDSPSAARVEALPAFLGTGNPATPPRPFDVETQPGGLHDTPEVRAVFEVLQDAVDRSSAGCRKDAAAAAWHAERVARFFCATFRGGIVGVRVSDDGFIVINAELDGNDRVDTSIVVGPEGTCACRITVGDTHLASTASDARSFQKVLKSRRSACALGTAFEPPPKAFVQRSSTPVREARTRGRNLPSAWGRRRQSRRHLPRAAGHRPGAFLMPSAE